ncbi:MAG: hypothetical protein HQ509_06200 [Candidatus Marinimicrobia bacterium]|nr:hypothetical protein [Candidatus Neomarinimicrobiota bacterium]
MKLIVTIILIGLCIFFSGCPDKKETQDSRDTTIHLTEVSTGIFSSNLKVSIEDTSDSWMFGLSRNDSIILAAEVSSADTIINDNQLLPKTEYSYTAFWLDDGERVDTSETLTVLTDDTTSHNFIWEIDTLGIYGSYLNDVAVVDENNIWVVGKIVTDSSTYNAAHWDGEDWEMIKVLTGHTANKGILYFSADDIWVTSGFPIHWNGQEWTLYHLQNMGLGTNVSVEHLWASSPNNIYFAGPNGSIVNYNGSSFVKMESGIDVDLNSISGTGPENIWVSGLDSNTDGLQEVLLHYDGNSWRIIVDQVVTSYTLQGRISGGIAGVYVDSPDSAWVYTHLGLYRCSPNLYGEGNLIWNTTSDGTAVKTFGGINRNDIFAAGTYAVIWHYNGLSFHRYTEVPEIGTIIGMDTQINVAVFVGSMYAAYKSFIIRGYR